MDPQTVRQMADQFPWASWAVWDEEFPDGDCIETTPSRLVEFMADNAPQLKSAVVLLGLNRAADLPAPFSNFHATSGRHFDDRLKEFIQDANLDRLRGAYMTDLVDEIDPDSKNIQVTNRDATLLFQQLNVLGADEFDVICFGNKPFDGLVRYFDAEPVKLDVEVKHASAQVNGLSLSMYRVWFYGNYGANQDKVELLARQLECLNREYL